MSKDYTKGGILISKHTSIPKPQSASILKNPFRAYSAGAGCGMCWVGHLWKVIGFSWHLPLCCHWEGWSARSEVTVDQQVSHRSDCLRSSGAEWESAGLCLSLKVGGFRASGPSLHFFLWNLRQMGLWGPSTAVCKLVNSCKQSFILTATYSPQQLSLVFVRDVEPGSSYLTGKRSSTEPHPWSISHSLFWDSVLLNCPDWCWTFYITQAGLNLAVSMSQPL